MNIETVHIIYWSYSGTTEAFALQAAEDLKKRGMEPILYNMLKHAAPPAEFSQKDFVIALCPVFAGRLPAHAADSLKKWKGGHSLALAAVVYGNRDYDDALLELSDLLKAQDFCLAGAAALVAQHSIFPKTAQGRPDEGDKMKFSFFLLQILQKLSSCKTSADLPALSVPGNRPYKDVSGVRIPLKPQTSSKCNNCGLCSKLCPVQAIDPRNSRITNGEICISCTACIANCPTHARKFPSFKHWVGQKAFCKQNSLRKEPEFFL